VEYHAQDSPAFREPTTSFYDNMREALEYNPDYVSQRQQLAQENIRVMYAHNQTWPQLDLKGSYGLNGLNESVSSSWEDVQTRNWPVWSIGVELRIPITGGIKGRNEFEAAKLRKREALLGLKSAEVEIANSLDTAIRRIANTRESVTNYQTVVEYDQRLLQTEISRLDVGKTEIRKVFEAEELLSDSRSIALETLVAFEKSFIEWELIKGTLLKSQNLGLSKVQLNARTADILRDLLPQAAAYDGLRLEAKREFEQKWPRNRTTPDANP
jgi:outer membrane protein TolC